MNNEPSNNQSTTFMKPRKPIEYLSMGIIGVCMLYRAYYLRKHGDVDTPNIYIALALLIFIVMAINLYVNRKRGND